MQKIKRPLSIILAILMLVTMIPFSSLTASAGNGQEVGDFVLRGGVEGTDFKYENGVLTVLTDKHLIIQNQNSLIPTKDRIYVAKDVSANIEMSGVKIDVSNKIDESNKYVPAFEIAEGSTGNVTINLGLDAGIGVDFVERSKNYLKSGASHAGIQKNSNEDSGKLTIVGQGMLTAIGGERAAGIGGSYGKSACNIEIASGSIEAIAGDSGIDALYIAGIGGGPRNRNNVKDRGGNAANIKISGGLVTATGATGGSALGIGYLGSFCKNISITGGNVILNAGHEAYCIGCESGAENNSITGGTVKMNASDLLHPNLFYWTTEEMSYNNCIVYHNEKGQVYGNHTLPYDHLVEAGQTLTIPKGATLTIPKDTKLSNHGTIIKEGNLVVNGDIVCNGHNCVNYVCTRCFKPCEHSKHTNGFCVYCGQVTEEIKYNATNNCYEISNAGELLLFAEKTQSDNTINAVLNADITLNEGTITADSTGVRTWTPIALNYAGTFDGNGHSISGLYLKGSDDFQGFIRSLSSNGTVKKLTIKNSYFSGAQYTGGITGDNSGTVDNCHVSATVNGTEDVGGIAGRSSALITKCSNSGKISATNDNVGGITGRANVYDGAAISYCGNTGYVTGRDFVGGILGFGHDTPITNSYNTGKATFNENGPGQFYALGSIVANNNSFNAAVNCYYLDTAITTGGIFNINYKGHTEEATLEQFKSGEIAYRLNGNGEKVWCQKIGKDEFPQLKGDKVYYGYTSCSSAAEQEYTNIGTASSTKPDHTEKTAANCVDLAVCGICSESYGKTNADNHKSDKTYSVYVDDTHHKDYHSCCNAPIGNCSHSKSTAANCISKDYCNECKSYYGSINASNHADEFTWADNGDGTHSKKWECCNLIENEIKPHSFTITADDKNNVITASCNDCEYEASITLVAP